MRFRCNTIYINIKSPSLPFLSAAQVPWHPTAGWSFGWRASRRCPWFQLVSAGFSWFQTSKTAGDLLENPADQMKQPGASG